MDRMTNGQKAEEKPVKDTQDAAVPTADQKTSEPQTDQSGAPKEISTDQTTGEELPSDASERTRSNFEKMREQLRDERAKREYYEQVFNSMQPKAEEAQVAPIYDPETGLLNETALSDIQQRALEAEKRAKQAEGAVQQYLQDQEEREVFSVHPDLNPKGKTFDKTLHQVTKSLMLQSMLEPQEFGNRQLSFMEAAVEAKKFLGKNAEVAKIEGAKEALQVIEPKEQASLEAQGNSARGKDLISQSEEEDLRQRVRSGDEHALAELLSRKAKRQ